MKRKLNDQEVEQLNEEVKLAKEIGYPTQTSIAKDKGISLHTLIRYINPEYRKYSREIARDNYYYRKNEDFLSTIYCHECKEGIVTHAKCPHCEILLHGEDCRCRNLGPFNPDRCMEMLAKIIQHEI